MKSNSTNLVMIIQLAIGTLILGVSLRTWLVMGLIEPVTVAGSSMAPALLGPHLSVVCQRCQHSFHVGAEFAVETVQAECPQCGSQEIPLHGLSVLPGDRLVIDRTAFAFRLPRRWEPVVFLSPEDEGKLVVKRVVGLPRETIELRHGDVWIDGQIAQKPLSVRNTLRCLVHRETTAAQRWNGVGWDRYKQDSWFCQPQPVWCWLEYEHPHGKPVTDDSAYNAGLSRRLFAVSDLILATEVHTSGNGTLAICLNESVRSWEIRLALENGNLDILSDEKVIGRKKLSKHTLEQLQSGNVMLEIASVDQRLSVAIAGQDVITLARQESRAETVDSPPRLRIGARNLQVSLQDIRLYRDIYYASLADAASLQTPMVSHLGDAEIFVLGDNVAVSFDSRHGGPLPLRFLVGRPLGVR